MFGRALFGSFVIAAVILATSPSRAEWFYEDGEKDLGLPPSHMALTLNGNYMAGFRCEGEDILSMFYITPEQLARSDIKTLSRQDPQMLVRIDDGDIITMPVTMELTNDGTLAVWTHAEAVERVTRMAASAEGQMSVAIEILGERLHIQDFDVRGSTRSVNVMRDACGL